MRLHLGMTLFCYLIVSSPAFSATQKQIHDCTMSENLNDKVTACTAILNNKGEGKQMRSLTLTVRGTAQYDMGAYDEALSDLNAALDLNAENAMAYDSRARLWRDRNELDRAVSDFSDAIKFNSAANDRRGLALTYSQRAITWQMKGAADKALDDYNAALKLDDATSDLYLRRARFYIETKRWEPALADLNDAIKRDAENIDALYLRGALRYERYVGASEWIEQDDLDGALSDLNKVVTLLPRSARAFYLRALVRSIDGDKKGMVADLIDSYKIDPNDPQVIAILERVQPDYKVIAEPLNKLMDWPPAPGRRSN